MEYLMKFIVKRIFNFAFILAIIITNTYGSDNIAFVQTSNAIGVINGATMTAEYSSSVYLSYLAFDANNKPLLKTGDFNGDGKSDLLAIRKSGSTYYIYVYSLTNTAQVLWYKNLNSTISGFKSIMFVNVMGDLNGDGCDDINFVYENTDNGHESSVDYSCTGSTMSLLSGPENIVNFWSYGKIQFANAGDFENSDGKKEIVFIYNDTTHPGYQTALTYRTYPSFQLISNFEPGYNGYPLVGPSYGKIQFTDVGDFNNDGLDELLFIFNDTTNSGYQVAMTYRVTGTFGLLSGNQGLGSQYHWGYPLVGKNYSVPYPPMAGWIISTNVGDFNGDGKDEFNFIFDDCDGVHQTSATYDAISFAKLSGPYNVTNKNTMGTIKSMGSARIVIPGDFNGDGRDEVYICYSNGSNDYCLVADVGVDPEIVSVQPNLIYNYSNPNNSPTQINISYATKTSKLCNYISYLDDQNYKSIPSQRNGSTGTYNISWYNDMPIPPSDPDYSTYQYYETLSSELGQYSSVNVLFDWQSEWYAVGNQTGITTLQNYLNNTISSYTYPKKGTVNLLPWVYNQYPSTFQSHFNTIKNIATVEGYYTGDDFAHIADSYNAPNLYQWSDFDAVNNYAKTYDPNRFTYASEAWNGIVVPYQNGHATFDIPMVQSYIFINSESAHLRYWRMIHTIHDMSTLKSYVKSNNQPGFIYTTQAHGDRSINMPWPQYIAANWKESRYDIFNAIVNGAGGISIWDYTYSDTFSYSPVLLGRSNAVHNINHITAEITNNAPMTEGTMQKALANGQSNTVKNFPVLCSKSGYDEDCNIVYEGVTVPWGSSTPNWYNVFEGRSISDINYILRESNGVYYLITVNNSELTVTNTRFYLPYSIASNPSFAIKEVWRDSVYSTSNYSGTEHTTIESKNSIRLNKKRYSYFDVSSYQPFEVKVFKMGTSLPKRSDNDPIKIDENSNDSFESFQLNQNYPNPFNPSTSISYLVPQRSFVKIVICDALGREIKTIVDQEQQPGRYSIVFNAKNLSSGVYYYRMTAGKFSDVKKLLLLK